MNVFALLDDRHRALLRRFYSFFKPHRTLWAGAAALALFSLLLTLPLPWITMRAVDKAITEGNAELFTFLIILWTAATLIRLVVGFLSGSLLMKFQLRSGQAVRGSLVEHLLHLPISYFSDKQIGYLTSRLFQDAEDSVATFGGRLVDFLRNLLSLVAGCLIVFAINWKLAVLSMALVPFYFINQFFFKNVIRQKELERREAWAKVGGSLQEVLSGIYSVKAYGMEGHEVKKFDEKSQLGLQKSMESWLVNQYSRGILGIVQGVGPIAIFAYAGYLILNHAMTVGELVGFTGYTGMLFGPAANVFDFFLSLQVSLVSTERVYEIVDTPRERSEAKTRIDPRTVQGSIAFHNVIFSYVEHRGDALQDFNLSISPGEAVGIVGRSGSGKTTVASLLLNLYQPRAGVIAIDGVDITTFDFETLRQVVCVVPQEPFLFTGSIRDNIRYGNPNASDAEVESAARQANVQEFIHSLPLNYETQVGERGVQLSGGQKQMISIARAFLRNPRIIVLDEATSAIDSQSEQLIKSALKALMTNRTSIVISHRLSSLLNVERVIVLDGGRVAEEGSHRELYSSESIYRRLFEEQLSGHGSQTRLVADIHDSKAGGGAV